MANGVRRFLRQALLNVIAASLLTPRSVRLLIYRMVGLQVHTLGVSSGCWIGDGPLSVGRGTFVNIGCLFDTSASITIGTNCAIGPRVMIITSTHATGPTDRRAGDLVAASVDIGDGVWIGAGAVVLPGVRVGNGVVIGAGAYVTKDCQPDTLYMGVPATAVRGL